MAKAVHTMIRVLDEERSIAFYQAAFGLGVLDRYAFPEFTLLYLRNDETAFELELTVNHGRTAPYDLGDGYGHLAFTATDLEALHARLQAASLEPTPIKELRHQASVLARFFFLTDPDGYKIEVIEAAGRFVA